MFFLHLSEADAAVTLFPAAKPPGVIHTPHYRVEVQAPEGWQPSHVNFNPARTDGSGASDQPGRSMSWTTFHTDAPVRVRVTSSQWSAFGAGQLGAPGRNYFIGDVSDFHFDGFRVGGNTITSPDAGQFDFGPGAGSGFEFN